MSEQVSPEKIVAYQRDVQACKEVFAVVIRLDGDASVSSLYDTREAAVIEQDWHNRRPAYYGRAHIEIFHVLTTDLARRRFVQ